MKTAVGITCLITAVILLAICLISGIALLKALLDNATLKGDLWLLLFLTFVGGGIMLAATWGVAESLGSDKKGH